MYIELNLWILLLIPFSKTTEAAEEKENCLAKNGEKGICMKLKNCEFLILSWKTQQPRNRTFFDQYATCGNNFLGQTLHCCTNYPQIISFDKKTDTNNPCQAKSKMRVSGGKNAKLEDYPYAALLEYKIDDDGTLKFLCSGVLIDKLHVVTAAHCTFPFKINMIYFGEWNTEDDPDCLPETDSVIRCNPKVLKVPHKTVYLHENYDTSVKGLEHDIALIRLKEPLQFSETVQPICLPLDYFPDVDSLVGQDVYVVGWGKTEKGIRSNIKQQASLPIISQKKCNSDWKRTIPGTMFCAGEAKGVDSCDGDSGGPIVRIDNNNEYLVGIVVAGPEHCGTQAPGLYLKISNYLEWIKNVTHSNKYDL